ncbi:MAG TPA: uroporphyrinogen-III C-methyltransferase [Porticoccaceae bacterium]|nr:uroporphyrinogen-III C-methyltransferase [Porticoccaceae bacterium]
MNYLPLFHRIQGRTCLVVGGGQVALRKLRILTEAGAHIVMVAPEVDEAVAQLLKAYQQARSANVAVIRQREFIETDLDGVVLAVAATADQTVNTQVSQQAQARNIAVNVVDQPELCTVIFPAVIDRSPVQVAISSGGASPVLVRQLRGQLEALLPAALGRLAELAGRFRHRVQARIADGGARRRFWESALEGEIPERVYAGDTDGAESALEQALAIAEATGEGQAQSHKGEVYLVGAGPGDPDLLTFRALRLMQQADVVLYDRLVSPGVLAMVRRDAAQIYVGKRAGCHSLSQPEINDKLIELARDGKRVLRLKGGDPFIFGRGGEEIERLSGAGITFQVVPGITAATGCASYAGIPLTHRDCAQSVRFIAGHKQDGKLELDWSNLVNDNETLVFYMSLRGLEDICSKLREHGMPADMPAALVAKGTLPEQRVLVGDLQSLPIQVRDSGVRAPTLLIIGRVVGLRGKLNWFKGTKE